MKGFAPAVEWILRSVREWFMGAARRFPVAGSCSAQLSARICSWLMASVDIEPCWMRTPCPRCLAQSSLMKAIATCAPAAEGSSGGSDGSSGSAWSPGRRPRPATGAPVLLKDLRRRTVLQAAKHATDATPADVRFHSLAVHGHRGVAIDLQEPPKAPVAGHGTRGPAAPPRRRRFPAPRPVKGRPPQRIPTTLQREFGFQSM